MRSCCCPKYVIKPTRALDETTRSYTERTTQKAPRGPLPHSSRPQGTSIIASKSYQVNKYLVWASPRDPLPEITTPGTEARAVPNKHSFGTSQVWYSLLLAAGSLCSGTRLCSRRGLCLYMGKCVCKNNDLSELLELMPEDPPPRPPEIPRHMCESPVIKVKKSDNLIGMRMLPSQPCGRCSWRSVPEIRAS